MLSSGGPLAAANTYRFSSKEIMVNSGLYYYGFRFYGPTLQRWVNRDPIQERSSVNLYSYVDNGPTISADSWGLSMRPAFPRNCMELDNLQTIKDGLDKLYRDFKKYRNGCEGYGKSLAGMCNGAKRMLNLLQRCLGPWGPQQARLFKLAKDAVDEFCDGPPRKEADDLDRQRRWKQLLCGTDPNVHVLPSPHGGEVPIYLPGFEPI